MPRTLRARTCSQDNIAIGSVSGQERTLAGAAPPPEKVGGKDNIKVGGAFPTTVIADNQQVGQTTMPLERRTP